MSCAAITNVGHPEARAAMLWQRGQPSKRWQSRRRIRFPHRKFFEADNLAASNTKNHVMKDEAQIPETQIHHPPKFEAL